MGSDPRKTLAQYLDELYVLMLAVACCCQYVSIAHVFVFRRSASSKHPLFDESTRLFVSATMDAGCKVIVSAALKLEIGDVKSLIDKLVCLHGGNVRHGG
jgi:hypothetical protein